MADNTELNAGTGGDTIASDDIGGVKHQRVKLSVGADGAASDAVPVSNGMDVTGAAVQAVGIVAQFDDTSVGTVTENQFAPVRISSRRALLVEGVASGTVIPISDGSGSLTVDAPVGTPAFVRLSDGSAAITTLPVSLASVPSHAVTNAGTFATQVDGAALTALQLIDDIVYTDDTSTHSTGTSKGALIMAAATPSDASVSANDIGAVAMTTDRKLHVSVQDALPAGTNAIGKLSANSGVDIGDVDVTTVGTITPGTAATSLGKAEDAAHASGDVGVMALGVRAAAPTERSAGPTDGDYEPYATNEVGAVWVSHTHSANGGASTFNATSSDGATALTSTAQAVKASAGALIGYYCYNPNASAQFVQFFNTASGSVTVGTTNPLFMITIPPTSAANLWMPGGVAFSTAIAIAATSTAGGNGAPSTALDVVVWYK